MRSGVASWRAGRGRDRKRMIEMRRGRGRGTARRGISGMRWGWSSGRR